MQPQRKKSPAGIIAITVLLSLLVLGAFSYVFIRWLMPMYSLEISTVYGFLVRILPILVGLIMIQIAVIIAPPRVPGDVDEQDELDKDEFTAPLYNLPVEDEPASTVALPRPAAAMQTDVQKTGEEPQGPMTEHVAITAFTPPAGTPEVSVVEEPRTEAGFSAPGEKEIPAADTPSEPFAQVSQDMDRAVLFADYPYPIPEGSEIAELLEPIGETEPSDAQTMAPYRETVEDTFEERLASELAAACEVPCDLSVAIIEIPTTGTAPLSVDANVVQTLFNKLGVATFFYLLDDRHVAVILPFYRFEQTRRFFASLLEGLRKQHSQAAVKVGFSSLDGRDIPKETLIREARIAANIASLRSGYSIIGYDSDLETDEAGN